MSLYKQFKTDESLETAGVEVWYGDEWFTVARAGGSNKRFVRRMAAALKPHRRAIQTDTMDERQAERIVMEVFVDTVLLGWGHRNAEGEEVNGVIEGPDGEPLQFTRENAIRVLTDLPDLFRDLREQAERVGNFRRQEQEADEGNS